MKHQKTPGGYSYYEKKFTPKNEAQRWFRMLENCDNLLQYLSVHRDTIYFELVLVRDVIEKKWLMEKRNAQ